MKPPYSEKVAARKRSFRGKIAQLNLALCERVNGSNFYEYLGAGIMFSVAVAFLLYVLGVFE